MIQPGRIFLSEGETLILIKHRCKILRTNSDAKKRENPRSLLIIKQKIGKNKWRRGKMTGVE